MANWWNVYFASQDSWNLQTDKLEDNTKYQSWRFVFPVMKLHALYNNADIQSFLSNPSQNPASGLHSDGQTEKDD